MKINSKVSLVSLLAISLVFPACNDNDDNNDNENSALKEISMGADYEFDVYYSLSNGVATTPPRAEWDLGFTTGTTDASILINDGSGVALYLYPDGDSTDWDAADASNIASWPNLYNSSNEWTVGAFNRYTKPFTGMGNMDIGWGFYDMTAHSAKGDSIYILKTIDGSSYKFMVESRITNLDYKIKYEDLDGVSGATYTTIASANYATKNFVYYSFETEEVVDHEPAVADWDLQFTKYIDENLPAPYNVVTGVFVNKGVLVAVVEGSTFESAATPPSAEFVDSKTAIGADWKIYDPATHTLSITEDLVYFIKCQNGNIYKLAFVSFEGISNGNISFNLVKVSV